MDTFCFVYHPARRQEFVHGGLAQSWHSRYHDTLFDDKDLELATSQPDRHFFEWLSAVLLYEATGLRSLVEKYTSQSHPRKLRLFENNVTPAVFQDFIADPAGIPDLFVYGPTSSDWFFAEVKGAGDTIRGSQPQRLASIAARYGQSRVKLIELTELVV